MSSFIIKFKNTSNEEGTIIADAGFNYSDKLNKVNETNINISGSGESKRGLTEIGSEVKIYRNNNLDFYGLVDNIDFLEGGGISVHASGYEKWLGLENGAYANSPWKNTASATIFSNIIGESTKLNAGTIEAGTNIDFRAIVTDSLWNAISNLREKTQQDIQIDYANSEIDILDHKGSSSSVATFNAGIQIGNIQVSQSYPLGNKILVYGKGDGTNQIKSEYPSHGYDATSQGTYGIITKIIRDPTILSVAEANILADAEVAKDKDPVKIYDFEVLNPNQNLVSGDVLTLNAKSQGLSNESVRIVGIERGIRGGEEYLTLQVTNTAYARLLKNRNEILAVIEKNYGDYQSYMQGTTNVLTFADMTNADNSTPLKIVGYLPQNYIYDEAGNRRVNEFTFDYEVAPYRKSTGASSAANASTGGSVNNVSAYTNAAINNAQQNAAHGINNAYRGSSDYSYDFGPYEDNSWPNDYNWNDVYLSINIGSGTYNWHAAWVIVRLQHSTSDTYCDTYIRIKNTTDNLYYPSSSGIRIGLDTPVGNSLAESANLFGLIVVPMNWSSKNYLIQIKWNLLNLIKEVSFGYYGIEGHVHSNSLTGGNHTHSNSFNDAQHTNPNTFSDPTHPHSVTVGDGVSDAGSINSTGTAIYLDWWNGSSWVNKASGGAGLMGIIDLTAGGALPDNPGFWRTRMYTNNSSPDLIQGIMKLKHELDN